MSSSLLFIVVTANILGFPLALLARPMAQANAGMSSLTWWGGDESCRNKIEWIWSGR